MNTDGRGFDRTKNWDYPGMLQAPRKLVDCCLDFKMAVTQLFSQAFFARYE
jgi:hypothetical protein